MNTTVITKILPLLVITLLFGAGCGGATEETTRQETPVAEAPGTLTFTLKDPEKGLLSGTFENEGYTVTFDVARGEEMAIWYQAKGNPTHEIDARICDEKHFCFLEQAGGHSFANQAWIPDNSETNAPDDERALKNSKIVWQLHQKLLQLEPESFKGLEEELYTLKKQSNIPPEQWNLNAPVTNTQSNARTLQKSVLALAAVMNTYMQRFAISWQYVPGYVGEHSSAWAIVYTSGGTFVKNFITCNHGACANDSGMSPFCYRDFMNRSTTIPYNVNCSGPASQGFKHGSGTGCCYSIYGLIPGITSHVCNDDTTLQRDFMIANGYPPNTQYCSDLWVNRYTPSCM